MVNKLLKLSSFLKSIGLRKDAGDVEDFMRKGGNPLEKITDDINTEALKEKEISGIYMVSPGVLANIYIELIKYLKDHEGRYSHIVKNHFYDAMINKLNIAKFTLGITKDYIDSQSSIEGLTGPEADLDKSLKGNESKGKKLKYVDNMMNVFDFLTQLKEDKITEEVFSENISDIVKTFEKDTEVREESDRMKSYRKRRDSIRNRGRSGTLVPPPPTFEVLEGGKKDEDKEWKELAEMEIPDDAFEDSGEGDDEEKEEHSASHGKNYNPETHLYDPSEFPPGFFDD